MPILKIGNDRTADIYDIPFRNVDGAGSITQYAGVNLAVAGNSINGINATHPAAAASGTRAGFFGVATSTVAINGYGLARAWGLVNSILISNQGSSITITAGDICVPVVGTGLGFSSANAVITYNLAKFVFAGATLTVSASGYVDNAIVRAL